MTKGERMGKFLVGTSGYSYPHWKEVFYPASLAQSKWLSYYAEKFSIVELNVTFYRLPSEKTFAGWYKKTPSNFKFVAKGSRLITHLKKLSQVEEPLKQFFSRLSRLEEKLEVVLWQLPPSLKANTSLLENFCELVKENSSARQAFEFRHQSWFVEEVARVLQKYGFASCIAHSNRWPLGEMFTTNFIYLRFHGGAILYGSNYSDEEIAFWAKKTKRWLGEGYDVYAFFNNDAYGYAVANALKLQELVDLKS